HGLDERLASSIELLTELRGQHPAHERVHAGVPARAGVGALARVGWYEDLDAASGDVLHLHLMPIAGVRECHGWLLGDSNRFELALRGGDHRLKMTEVRRVDRDLGREHDVVLVDDRLRVVTLYPPARGLH